MLVCYSGERVEVMVVVTVPLGFYRDRDAPDVDLF
jgi:hypothetical protein